MEMSALKLRDSQEQHENDKLRTDGGNHQLVYLKNTSNARNCICYSRASQKSLWLVASPHPSVIKSVLPLWRGRAKAATRSFTLFGAGRGRGKRLQTLTRGSTGN